MQKWYNLLIELVFTRRFASFEYPFERSDAKIMSMQDAEKKEYYRQAKDLLENRVYVQEMQELIRSFYQDLSIKTVEAVDMQAHRLTLLAIQNLDKRIRGLASLYSPPTINDLNRKL